MIVYLGSLRSCCALHGYTDTLSVVKRHLPAFCFFGCSLLSALLKARAEQSLAGFGVGVERTAVLGLAGCSDQ